MCLQVNKTREREREREGGRERERGGEREGGERERGEEIDSMKGYQDKMFQTTQTGALILKSDAIKRQ